MPQQTLEDAGYRPRQAQGLHGVVGRVLKPVALQSSVLKLEQDLRAVEQDVKVVKYKTTICLVMSSQKELLPTPTLRGIMARPLDLLASGLSCNCTIVSGQHVMYTHGPTINLSTGHLHILAVPCQLGQLHYLLAASLCSTLSWEGGLLAPHRQTATQNWLSTCQTWRKTSKPRSAPPEDTSV